MDDPAYLAALTAAPDDDGLRQVWADALQARGEPRGELIALQLAAAHAAAAGDHDAAEALTDAADEVLADHEDALTPPGLAAVAPPRAITFRRGFVEAIKLRGFWFAACAEEVLATTPVLDLSLTTLNLDEAARLAALPGMARIRTLTLARKAIADDALAALLASPHLTGLRGLHVDGGLDARSVDQLLRSDAFAGLEHLEGNMTPADRRRLLTSSALPALHALTAEVHADDVAALTTPHRAARWTALHLDCRDAMPGLLASELPALRRLSLARHVDGDSVHAVATATLPALRQLRLASFDVSPAEVARLLAAPVVRQLEVLDLSRARLADAGMAQALAGARLPALRRLDLAVSDLDASGLRALLAWDLAGLEHLDLGVTRIGDDGAQALATARGLGRLRYLGLYDAHVTAAGARALGDAADLPALRELWLSDGALDDPAAAALGHAAGLPRLRDLHLGGERLLAAAATSLVRTPLMARLVTLDLSSTTLPADAFVALAANPDAHRLRVLSLHGCRGFSAESLLELARSPHLTRLRALDHRWTLTRARAQALIEAPGLRKVRDLDVRAPAAARAALTAAFGRRLAFR